MYWTENLTRKKVHNLRRKKTTIYSSTLMRIFVFLSLPQRQNYIHLNTFNFFSADAVVVILSSLNKNKSRIYSFTIYIFIHQLEIHWKAAKEVWCFHILYKMMIFILHRNISNRHVMARYVCECVRFIIHFIQSFQLCSLCSLCLLFLSIRFHVSCGFLLVYFSLNIYIYFLSLSFPLSFSGFLSPALAPFWIFRLSYDLSYVVFLLPLAYQKRELETILGLHRSNINRLINVYLRS